MHYLRPCWNKAANPDTAIQPSNKESPFGSMCALLYHLFPLKNGFSMYVHSNSSMIPHESSMKIIKHYMFSPSFATKYQVFCMKQTTSTPRIFRFHPRLDEQLSSDGRHRPRRRITLKRSYKVLHRTAQPMASTMEQYVYIYTWINWGTFFFWEVPVFRLRPKIPKIPNFKNSFKPMKTM